ncbi:unnamed protein product [Periconia digitata]|uniref:MFS general substrate transporter n=1 Tax=Periconia digitata TaxID=1303443 RepID=A0A9W4XNT9_9PLEO|nr:unnamed protein product [Periconia digitata]
MQQIPARRDSESSISTLEFEDNLIVPQLSTSLLFALTCAIGGLQLIWSTVFSHGSAYLFTLGITKTQSSLIWAIAPICGALVQPIVGAISDSSRSRWGRRRPFIVGGGLGVCLSLLTLAWVGSIGGSNAMIVQAAAIICILVLNVSMQPLQAGLRALIVDVCPKEQQSVASAWAGRLAGGSNILGYVFGSLPLWGAITENSGNGNGDETTRFRFMTVLSISVLAVTILATVYFIKEEDFGEKEYTPEGSNLVVRCLRDVKDGWKYMPLQSRRVCFVQFFAWMGWFGFLFYSTSYIASLYMIEERKRGVEQKVEYLGDAGVRLGTFASLLSAILALATTIVAPYVASSTNSKTEWWRETHILWFVSHLLYALCTFCTIFVSTVSAAIILVTVTGISWGITQWAPFALIGEDIATHHIEKDSRMEKGGQRWMSSQSGAMMGVHNAAISLPQILAALGSSVVFWIFEESKPDQDVSLAWVLRASGVAALVAAYLAWRLK